MKIKLDDDLLKYVSDEEASCTGCRKCMKACPMLDEFCSTPKALLEETYLEKSIDHEVAFSCTLCGHCSHVCPESVDLNHLFYVLRESGAKQFKIPGSMPVKFHQKNSFSKPFSTGVEGLKSDIKEKVFFPGCALTAYDPSLVLKIYVHLRQHDPGIGIMLNCCGNPTHVMGDTDLFNEYFYKTEKELDKSGVKEIITVCPNCHKTLSKDGQAKVISLWEVLCKFGLPEGLLNKYQDMTVTIHDPCPTRYNPEIHDAVRKLMDDMGFNLVEMIHSRENTLCCGSGGMVAVMNQKVSLKQKKMRVKQTEEDFIVSYCQECVESLTIEDKRAIHILDMIYSDKPFERRKQSTLEKWMNRYQAKRKVMTLDKRGQIS
ncbi:(Fe-S)-binding protein [Acidaminobacter sp. JC074]|uniref:(Fe-S)-binding protein n=1 Tax=Acidaminobacter sp. JC074 TaxID=2530199 RepID=UPI001F0E370B|nr:(Fe-S)-binding protein [Acidaminobacter sp. JC074]MCH4890298.1 (Fe-S)-binding protein [Acidaminobacter sp. JC074]